MYECEDCAGCPFAERYKKTDKKKTFSYAQKEACKKNNFLFFHSLFFSLNAFVNPDLPLREDIVLLPSPGILLK